MKTEDKEGASDGWDVFCLFLGGGVGGYKFRTSVKDCILPL